jgi:hypothetical protein
MKAHPSAQYSVTMRIEINHVPGMLGKVASAIGDAGGRIGAVDLISMSDNRAVRDFTIETWGVPGALPVGADHTLSRRTGAGSVARSFAR